MSENFLFKNLLSLLTREPNVYCLLVIIYLFIYHGFRNRVKGINNRFLIRFVKIFCEIVICQDVPECQKNLKSIKPSDAMVYWF